jgi:hypothetical protein
MNKIFALLFFLSFHTPLFAQAEGDLLNVKIKDDSILIIRHKNVVKNFTFKGNIYGYSINCKKEKIIVWGTPSDLSNSAPQAGYFALIDLKQPRLIVRRKLGRGIMNVDYLENGGFAHLVLGYGMLVNLRTGKAEYIDTAKEDQLTYESCPEFEGKNFNK